MAGREQRVFLPIRRDVERHALSVFIGEYGLRADLGIVRRVVGRRLRRDDAHPAQGHARARHGVEDATRARRADDGRTPSLVVRRRADERRRRDLRRVGRRPRDAGRRAAAAATRGLLAGPARLAGIRAFDLAGRRRLLVARHGDGLVLWNRASGFLERRSRSIDDLADGVPTLLSGGPAVLHARREFLRQLQLRCVSGDQRTLYALDPDAARRLRLRGQERPLYDRRVRRGRRRPHRHRDVALVFNAR